MADYNRYFSSYESVEPPIKSDVSINAPLPSFLQNPINSVSASNQYNDSKEEGLQIDIPWLNNQENEESTTTTTSRNKTKKQKYTGSGDYLKNIKQHTSKVENAYNTLRQWGYSSAIASGILGNAWQESGFNINAVGDGGKARGWFQMHKQERDNYNKWKKANASRIKGLPEYTTQSLYVADAITNRKNEYGIKVDAHSINDPSQIALLVSKHYERPNAKYANNNKRQVYAMQISNYFNTPTARFGAKLDWIPKQLIK